MTIDPEDFKAQGMPTNAQMRAVWVTLPKPSVRTLQAKLRNLGYKISPATVGRAVKAHFCGDELIAGKVLQARKPKLDIEVPNAPKLIGEQLTPKELSDIERDMIELKAIEDMAVLKAIFEKERLVTNIMLMRFTQRRADALVLIPKDTSTLVVAMTDANESLSEAPAAKLNGHGNGQAMIDVTPNATNPISSAIESFQRKRSAA